MKSLNVFKTRVISILPKEKMAKLKGGSDRTKIPLVKIKIKPIG